MPKTYTLQGPIVLENLNNTQTMTFLAAVIDAVPSYSMGSASMNVKAQGPAGQANGCVVEGDSLDELKASLKSAQKAPKAPEDIVYSVRGRVNLVGLSFEDGMQVIEAVMHAIPEDSLVVVAMLAQESAA
jgi:hypothetical protein